MAATVADALFNRLIDAFPPHRAYPASELTREPMPEPLRVYFEQRILQHLDEAAAHGSPWLDADHAEIRQAKTAYRDVLARHIRVPAAEWRSELALACRTVASYLIQPVPTLTDLVFEGGKEDASADEVRERLDALPAYPYFSEVINAYLERKDLERISRERLAGLARRIDHQMVRDFGADEWMDLLEPLLDVTRQLPEFSGAIPLDALRAFLKEKDAGALVSRLDERFGARRGDLIDSDELREFFEQPAEEIDVPEEAQYGREPVEAAERVDRTDPSGRGSHVPLWKQFESGLHRAPEPAAPSRPREAAPAGAASGAQPLWKQFRGGSALHEEAAPREDAVKREDAARREDAASREDAARRQDAAIREDAARRQDPATREDPAQRSRRASGSESMPPARSASTYDTMPPARTASTQETTPPVRGARGAETQSHDRLETRDIATDAWAPRGSSHSGTTLQDSRGDYAPRTDSAGGSAYYPPSDPLRNSPHERDTARGVGDEPLRVKRASESISGRTMDASAHAHALEDLERSVLGQKGMRNRSLFMRQLFSGSERAYEDTLRLLYAAESWSEASQIIAREVFLKHQVNIYSEPAVAFTDAAEARFRR